MEAKEALAATTSVASTEEFANKVQSVIDQVNQVRLHIQDSRLLWNEFDYRTQRANALLQMFIFVIGALLLREACNGAQSPKLELAFGGLILFAIFCAFSARANLKANRAKAEEILKEKESLKVSATKLRVKVSSAALKSTSVAVEDSASTFVTTKVSEPAAPPVPTNTTTTTSITPVEFPRGRFTNSEFLPVSLQDEIKRKKEGRSVLDYHDSPLKMTPQEEECLAYLKNEVSKLPADQKGLEWMKTCSEITRLRFIRGHKQKKPLFMKMFIGAAEWRADYKPESLLKEWEEEKEPGIRFMKDTFPFGVVSLHNDRAVFLFRFAMVDFPGYYGLLDEDLFLKHTIWAIEYGCVESPTEDSIMILDIGMTPKLDKNPPVTSVWEIQRFVKFLIRYLMALTKVADPMYPETQYRIVFVRAPSLFWSVWKIISVFINETTKEKIDISTADDPLPALLKHLPLSAIPDCLGGEASTSHLPKGGKLPDNGLDRYKIKM